MTQIKEQNDFFFSAEAAFDEGDFTAAVDLYRKAARHAPHISITLTNLTIAEKFEKLKWCREIRSLYPDNSDITRTEIDLLIELGYLQRAMNWYTELLQQTSLSVREEINYLLNRFRLICRTAQYDKIVAEFTAIWVKIGDLPQKPHVLWRTLLNILLTEITDIKAITALKQLAASPAIPPQIQQIVQTKITSLETISEFFGNLDNQQRGFDEGDDAK